MTDEQELLSTCIMLIPDNSLRERRPDVREIHMTVAYLGHFEPHSPILGNVRKQVHSIAQGLKGIGGVANGTGIFPDRGGRYAIVDLIDGVDSFYARKAVESLFGKATGAYDTLPVRIDYTHGFTPHITREYLMPDDMTPEMLVPSEPIPFKFEAIGLWHGPEHYEVAL